MEDKPSTFLVRNDEEAVDFIERMEDILERDDKHEFVSLVNSLTIHEDADDDYLVSFTRHGFNDHDPVNCAAALLSGETDCELLSPNTLLSEDGLSFLHTAARFTTPRITALLLDSGHDPNLRSDVAGFNGVLEDALSLNVSLDNLCYWFWSTRLRNGTASVIRLITELFSSPSWDIMNLRLLEKKTKEIKHEFFKYLKQGKVAEVAALLMVAHDRILSQDDEDGNIGFKNIMEMSVFVLSEILSLSVDPSYPKSQRETQLSQMEATLQFLHIFGKIGDKLLAHTRVFDRQLCDRILGVVSLIQDAGFHVATEDGYESSTQSCGWIPYRTSLEGRAFSESSAKVFNMELLPSWLKEEEGIDRLSHGVDQVNVSTDEHGSMDPAMVPLSVALAALCQDKFFSDWTPEKSIYKLIYIFCLKEMKEALETIKLLVEKTEDIDKVGLHSVDEGQVVQFAALLLVAWDRLVPENAEESVIGRYIWKQIGRINNQESRLMITSTSGPKCEELECLKKKKIDLLMMWKLLRVLELGREVIEDYPDRFSDDEKTKEVPDYEVPFEVACQLYIKAMRLTPDDVYSDDIECLRPKLKEEEKVRLNEAIDNELKSMTITLPKLQAQDEALLNEFLEKTRDLQSKLSTTI